MTKEELIKLIETLSFEEVRCMTLSYYRKKTSKYSYDDSDYSIKTICIGTDLEKVINQNAEHSRQRINDAFREIQKIREEIEKENK